MSSGDEILAKLRELKPELSREYAVKRIGLFGSFSNETQTEDSDIDLLVELERPIGWKFFTLELHLEKVFGRKIDLVTSQALKDQIRLDILNNVKYV